MSLKTLQKRADAAAKRKEHKLVWGKVTLYKGARLMQFGTCEHCKHLAMIIDRADTPQNSTDLEVMDLGPRLRKTCQCKQ